MRLTAQITIEVDAENFAAAAEHERDITALVDAFRARYGECRLEIRQKRHRLCEDGKVRERRPRSTGALAVYVP